MSSQCNLNYQFNFLRCVQNMYEKIKEHDLQDDFLDIDCTTEEFKNTGFTFCDHNVINKIYDLTKDDSHSGSSFGCCCYNVYNKLSQEKKRLMRCRFRGVVTAIVQFKRLRFRVLVRLYMPGGKGFLNAQKNFHRIQQGM